MISPVQPPVRCLLIATALLSLLVSATAIGADQANIVIIVADDLGFNDIGSFGSEIETPNIDSLSRQGLRLTRFYTASTCSPTRAMLMSGTDSHLAGLGRMVELIPEEYQRSQPGYEGYLNERVVSLANLMKDAGYHTYMAGKWHLGNAATQSPTARGFERTFALLSGAASHFDDMAGYSPATPQGRYWQDGEEIFELPSTFYSSDFYASRIMEYIDSNVDDGSPFFAYLSFTAPHSPLHAPAETMTKYRGKYTEGWDVIRERRFDDAKSQGVINEDAELPSRESFVQPWDSLDPETRECESRLMEVYAAMVDRMDYNIGRVIEHLERRGILENTYIVFFSDNGADASQYKDHPMLVAWYDLFDNQFDSIGHKGSHTFYGAGWAQAGEAPFRLSKTFTTEGGIRTPAIIVSPDRKRAGEISDDVATVIDLLPTFLDIAGTKPPSDRIDDREIYPPTGYSLLPILTGGEVNRRDGAIDFGIELYNRRAIIKGDWKLVRVDHPEGSDAGWELFDLSIDQGEQHDLAASNPEKLAELVEDWEGYVIDNGVVLPD